MLTRKEIEPRKDEDGYEDTADALAIFLFGKHVNSQNIGNLESSALHRLRRQHDALLEIYHLLGGEGEPEDVVEACKARAEFVMNYLDELTDDRSGGMT